MRILGKQSVTGLHRDAFSPLLKPWLLLSVLPTRIRRGFQLRGVRLSKGRF